MLQEELCGIQAVAEVRFTPTSHDIAVIMWLHRFPLTSWQCQHSYEWPLGMAKVACLFFPFLQ